MLSRQWGERMRWAGRIFVLVASVLLVNASASTTQVIYSFAGDDDGEYADTELVIDSTGNLYGTTVQGGDSSAGTVFELSPGSTWTHTVLYSFKGAADGGEPYKGVTLDTAGNLYGTAGVGGMYVGPCSDTGCGVVFKMVKSGSQWTYHVIHYFTGLNGDGFGPGVGVTIDKRGNVYGMTPTGGADSAGIVFELTPDGHGKYTERIIHTFTGGVDGNGGSAGRLALDGFGNLYGTCTTGGANGAGNVFELTPTQSGEFTLTVLYAFNGNSDSGFPYGGVVADAKSNIYGTTYYDGANGWGTIYRLSLRSGAWTETGIYSFLGGRDGSGPISTLVFDQSGNLYGTTSTGGGACDCGTIFSVNPNSRAYSVAYRFNGPPDGAFVYNGMVADSAGNFYGATVQGGTGNDGAIYKFTP